MSITLKFWSIILLAQKLGFPGSSAVKEICLQCRRPQFDSWVGKIPWRRDRLPIPVFLGFLGGSNGKESTHKAGDLSLITRLGRSPEGVHGNPIQYSHLENPHGQRSLVGLQSMRLQRAGQD